MRFLGLGFRARRRDLGYERFLLGFSGSFKDSSNEGFLMLLGLRGLGFRAFGLRTLWSWSFKVERFRVSALRA